MRQLLAMADSWFGHRTQNKVDVEGRRRDADLDDGRTKTPEGKDLRDDGGPRTIWLRDRIREAAR